MPQTVGQQRPASTKKSPAMRVSRERRARELQVTLRGAGECNRHADGGRQTVRSWGTGEKWGGRSTLLFALIYKRSRSREPNDTWGVMCGMCTRRVVCRTCVEP